MASSTVVTAAQSGDTLNGIALTVKVLTGQAASPIGTTAASGTVTSPELSITPSTAGSWVYGAVYDAGGSATLTPVAGTTFSQNIHDATNVVEYGTFRSTSVTTTSPTTYGASAPTNSSALIGIALLEILSGTGLAEDASSPAGVDTTSAITISTAAFNPPGGALLVAMVSSDTAGGGTVSMTTTVTDTAGLTWTRQCFGSQVVGSATYACASVWTATVPPGGLPASVQPVGTPATPGLTTSGTGTITVAGSWSGTQPRTAADYLLAFVTAHGTTSAAATAQASGTTGWTKLQEEVNGTNVSAIWGKVAAGADAAPSFTSVIAGTSAQTRLTCELVELTGQDTTTPVLTGATTAAGNTTSQVLTAAAATGRAGSIALTGVVEGFTTAATKTFTRSAGWANLANTGATSTFAHSSFDYEPGIAASVTAASTVGWGSGTITSSAGAMVVLQPPPSTTPISGSDASGAAAESQSLAATAAGSDASGLTADSQTLAAHPASSDAAGTAADAGEQVTAHPASGDASGLTADAGEKTRVASSDASGTAADGGEASTSHPASADAAGTAADAGETVTAHPASAEASGLTADAGETVIVNPRSSDASGAAADAGEALHAAFSGPAETSGQAADSQSLLARLSDTESSSALDGSLPHAVASADASSATADAGEHIAATASAADASGAAADAQALTAHPASSDTEGPATETSLVTLGAFSSDAEGPASDAGEHIAATVPVSADAGHGTDAGESVTAHPASSDVSGSTSDAGEHLGIAAAAGETGHGTDAGETSSAHPSGSDASGLTADAGALVAHPSGSDASNAAADAGGPPAAHLAGADAGHGTDAGENVISLHLDADTGHGTDAGEAILAPHSDTDAGRGTDSGFTYITDTETSHSTETQLSGPVGAETARATDTERTFWPADSDASGGVTETQYWSGPVRDAETSVAADAGEVIALADVGPYPGGDSSLATDTYGPGVDVYTYVPPSVITVHGGFQVVWHRPDGSAVLILSTDCLADALHLGRVIERSADVQFPSDSDAGTSAEQQQELLDVEASIAPALSVQVSIRDITT